MIQIVFLFFFKRSIIMGAKIDGVSQELYFVGVLHQFCKESMS